MRAQVLRVFPKIAQVMAQAGAKNNIARAAALKQLMDLEQSIRVFTLKGSLQCLTVAGYGYITAKLEGIGHFGAIAVDFALFFYQRASILVVYIISVLGFAAISGDSTVRSRSVSSNTLFFTVARVACTTAGSFMNEFTAALRAMSKCINNAVARNPSALV